MSLWSRDDVRLEREASVVLSIRESRRARNLSLQALPPRTVLLVVPRGFHPEIVRAFLHEHRDWIDRAGREMVRRYPEPELKPVEIDLKAVGRRVAVRYERAAGPRAGYRCVGDRISLRCVEDDDAACRALLRRWLLAEGRRCLVPWLEREAGQLGLVPDGIHVRLQKTRWGSCSARRVVSVNAALLLVRPALVRYLFVHELAHLEHLSHSRAFWRTVCRLEPDYEALDAELARSWSTLPAWLFALTHGNPA